MMGVDQVLLGLNECQIVVFTNRLKGTSGREAPNSKQPGHAERRLSFACACNVARVERDGANST
jgi:hypothetical protein